MWQLSIIGKGLKELPVDPETEVLRQQYEHWGELFFGGWKRKICHKRPNKLSCGALIIEVNPLILE